MTRDQELARVLVVDDEDDMREMLALSLGGQGYVVTGAQDGAAAIRAVRSERFDVVTLDLRMPGVGALETLRELKRLSPAVAVVVVSGYVTPAEEKGCLALGAFAVVRKPFTLEDLLATLRRARAAGTRGSPPAS